jgi:hypothetical protein
MVDPSESTRLGSLSESLRKLVEAEKACPDPSAAAQERVFARLSASLAVPFDPGTGPSVPAPPGAASTQLGRVLAHISRRGFATFLVGAAVGATVYGTAEHLSSRRSAAPSAAPSAPRVSEPPVTAPIPELPPSQPSAVPTAPTPRADEPGTAASANRATRPGDGRDHGLATERKLVEMARTALTRGEINSAFATLDRHVRLFPRGQLAEERDSLYVQALVTRGDALHARERAGHFHQQYPHSLFAPVVDQALRSIP